MSLKQLSLRQSLAMWTLVPMIAFSSLVLLLSFGWAWRNIQEVAREHNVSLAQVKAAAVEAWLEEGGSTAEPPCELIQHLTLSSPRRWYLVDGEGRVLCASPGAELTGGTYDLASIESAASAFSPSLTARGYVTSYAPVRGASWGIVLEEARAALFAPSYPFLVAITALMIVGLFISFWVLLVGFNRISLPLLAVTKEARRVAAGHAFEPPDVSGPSEVEALVAAFSHMVTQLRQQRDALQDYATRVLNSQEEERKRISRDLHDETAQELVGLMQRIDLCRLSAEENGQLTSALDELSDLTDRTLEGVRRMSRALRPLILEDLGLVPAVQAMAEELEEQLPEGRVFCEVIGDEQRLVPEAEVGAYRIVQEALTNVRKHASLATRVYVTLQFESQMLRISVEDNGPGFRAVLAESDSDREHLGLTGMRERAELLGGKWAIHSHPQEGTRVTLELPLRA
ncbi:MAG: ATP-binding protein [Anaerolineae bacterium]